MLPGASGGLTGRTAPPPFSEYAERWISPPGVEHGFWKAQPKPVAHHALVAAGSRLARSVWVIHPYRPRVNSCFCRESRRDRFGGRFALRVGFFGMFGAPLDFSASLLCLVL